VADGRSNIPDARERKNWKTNEVKSCNRSAYKIQNHDIWNKQMNAKLRWWQEPDAKRTEGVLQRVKRVQRSTTNIQSDIIRMWEQEESFLYDMDILSESFRQCATQLGNEIRRINWDQ